jgi:hypothetical protein
MAFQFDPTDGLLNGNVFPTVPESETAARQQFQTLLNQIRDAINAHLAESATRIITKRYSATVDVPANTYSRYATFSPTIPDGYLLIGYILGGLYTDSNKSSFYQSLVGSVSLSEPTRWLWFLSNLQSVHPINQGEKMHRLCASIWVLRSFHSQ